MAQIFACVPISAFKLSRITSLANTCYPTNPFFLSLPNLTIQTQDSHPLGP